jgi:zinc protease
VNRTEAKIKELFSSITVMPNAAKVVDEPVPDNYKPIIVVDKDKEQRYNILEIMFKHDAEPDSIKSSADYLITKCVKEIICNMLNSRFAEYAQKPESPFVLSMCDDDDYIFAKTKDAFSVTCLPKEGKMDEAIKTAFREVLRARQFGFTATEYERAKADYLSGLEKSYTNRNKRENEVFGDAYRDKFLSNEPIPSMEALYSTMNAIVPRIPLKLINEMLNSYVNNTDTNLVVLNMDVEKDGAVYATPEQLKKDIDEVRGETLTAYVDNVKNEPLITKLPKKGSIKKETENKILGYKELTLSNGAKVILKKTNFKDDEIVMDATSKSGTSILGDKDLSNGKLFESVISSSGLGDFNNTE